MFSKKEEVKAKEKEEVKEKTKDEWIWVDGYKGFTFSLKCNDMQYEIGKEYSIPEEEIVECKSGYHLCLNLQDVFKYYRFFTGEYCNRFCKVKALVRKEDFESYGKIIENRFCFSSVKKDKLVSKQIKIIEELSIEEIVSIAAPGIEFEYAKNILEYGKDIADLIKVGYTPATARWIETNNQEIFAHMLAENEEFSKKEKLAILINTVNNKSSN